LRFCQRSNIAAVRYRPLSFDFLLKYIPCKNELEAEILTYLNSLGPDEEHENHTVQLLESWKNSGGTFVAMPAGGPKAGDVMLGPHHNLLSLAHQLIDGVAFMHKYGVAHLDLKTDNVLVSLEGYLTIIDFSISERVGGVKDVIEGFVGTRGYTVPEVGRKAFSPILADVWACGDLLKEVCSEYEQSSDRDIVLRIAAELMNTDPGQRPRLTDVAKQLGKMVSPVTRPSATPRNNAIPWVREMVHRLHQVNP
jgi:serine/threonine protein kinase